MKRQKKRSYEDLERRLELLESTRPINPHVVNRVCGALALALDDAAEKLQEALDSIQHQRDQAQDVCDRYGLTLTWDEEDPEVGL